jgi:glucokinase
VACIVIGTGIGGGFIVEGRLWRGRNRLAGAVGWIPLPGADGLDHWENLASGPAIARRAKLLIRNGQASDLNAETLSAKDVFDAAREGDALAGQMVRETAILIGQGVASVISMANPEMVVLGGSIGQQGDLLLGAAGIGARCFDCEFGSRRGSGLAGRCLRRLFARHIAVGERFNPFPT